MAQKRKRSGQHAGEAGGRQEDVDVVDEEEEQHVKPKYVPGKRPRVGETLPPVQYNLPLDPSSELHTDVWAIPKFNLFVNYTLDTLVEKYRSMFKDFIKLPSRKFHPQYYYKVAQPISINEIKSRDYEFFEGAQAFLLDVELLTKNCYSYNDPDSLIVKNSMQIVNYIKYEVLKAKNIKRNYLITDDIRNRLLTYLDRLINSTDKRIAEEMGYSTINADDTLQIAQPFMDPVDKKTLPEYYEVIQRPVALATIRKNLEIGLYSKIYDLVIDVQMVFHNAQVFNDPETLIHQDAGKLLDFFNHLIQRKFFPEIQDASERGELQLEYVKDEIANNYLSTSDGADNLNDSNNGNLSDKEDLNDFETIGVEGLGNGYNRSLLLEDYLLGPRYAHKHAKDSVEGKKIKMDTGTPAATEDEELKILKYNIIKSLQNETRSEEYTLSKKTFEMIKQINISSSKSLYELATHPLPGSRPSCSQHWVEYQFLGADISQNENMFSFSLQPVQTFLTLTASFNQEDKSTIHTSLTVNKEPVKPNNTKPPTPNEAQPAAEPAPQEEENALQDTVPTSFDIRLNEGSNYVEFKCSNTATNVDEIMRFWISVLP